MSLLRVRLFAALLAVAALLLAACGNDEGSDDAPTDAPPPTEAPETGEGADDGDSDAPDQPYVETTTAIGETIWFEGFTFELEEVWTRVWNNGQTDTDVRVSGTVSNLLDDGNRPPGPITLAVDTFEVTAESSRPFVESGESEPIDLRWQVPANSDIADAVLYFGEESITRAQLALGDGAATRTNEPVDLGAPGILEVDGFQFDLDTLEVHFDRPFSGQSRFEGAAYVWFRGEVTNTSGEDGRRPSFRLVNPDGDDHVMNVRFDGGSSNMDANETFEIGFSYEVPADLPGDYYLIPTGGLPNQEPPRVFEFSIPPLLD